MAFELEKAGEEAEEEDTRYHYNFVGFALCSLTCSRLSADACLQGGVYSSNWSQHCNSLEDYICSFSSARRKGRKIGCALGWPTDPRVSFEGSMFRRQRGLVYSVLLQAV